MKERGHTLEIRRFDDDVEFEVLHPDSCPTLDSGGELIFECVTGWLVRENGAEDIADWRDLPEGKHPIAVELEPSDWPGAMDAHLVLDPKEER